MKPSFMFRNLIAFTIWLTAIMGVAFAGTDVTDSLELEKSRLRYDRLKGVSYLDVAIKNVSETELDTPIRIVINEISDSEVSVANPDGITEEGLPYFEYKDVLASGQSSEPKEWIFSNPGRRRFTYAVAMSTGGCAMQGAAWIPFTNDSGCPPPKNPVNIGIIESNAKIIELDIDIAGMYRADITENDQTYQFLDIPDGGQTGEIGKPSLPMVVNQFIAVPAGATVDVQVLNHKSDDLFGYNVYPAQEPPIDNDPPSPFEIDEAFYETDSFYPSDIVRFEGPFMLRGLSVIALRVYPVQFNPAKHVIRTFSNLSVKVSFNGGGNSFMESKYLSKSFGELLQRLLLNNDVVESSLDQESFEDAASDDGRSFLIITHPNFRDAADTLAQWKMKKGISTRVTTTEQIAQNLGVEFNPPDSPSADDIQGFIQDIYDSSIEPPSYLLLLGDAEFVPCHYRTNHPRQSQGMIGTDLYYTTVDGTDYLPDISAGRISVDTLDQANKRIESIIAYEQAPPFDTSFYENAAVCAQYENSRRFAQTSEDMAIFLEGENYTVNRIYQTDQDTIPTEWTSNFFGGGPAGNIGGAIPDYLLKAKGFAWEGNTPDILDAIERGAFLVTHRDHGHRTGGWGHPPFETADAEELKNGNLLPVIWSVNCQTGWFDNETDFPNSASDSTDNETVHFSEALERNLSGGAIGIIASTRNSGSHDNCRLFWGLTDAVWPEFRMNYSPEKMPMSNSLFEMGTVLNYGKIFYFSRFEESGAYGRSKRVAFELYHWFGDPTMQIWTRTPRDLNVDPLSALAQGETSINISVDEPDALICVSKDGTILSKTMSTSGGNTLSWSSPLASGDSVDVVITKHNFRPFIGSVIVGDNNTAPIADAGLDQTATQGELVTLDGSNSSDPDDGITSYLWEPVEGTSISLTNSTSVNPTFIAPNVDHEAEVLTFRLTVTDKSGAKDTDLCNVTVHQNQNIPPKANAGTNQQVEENATFRLDGSGSTDPDGAIVSYKWLQVGGTPATLMSGSNTTDMSPRYRAPEAGSQGETLIFELTVEDNGGFRHTDTCLVTVLNENDPPVAHAGGDQHVNEGNVVHLSGLQSKDDEGITSYYWRQTGGPSVTLSSSGVVEPEFTAPEVGPDGVTLTFTLTVSDYNGQKDTDDCQVFVHNRQVPEPSVIGLSSDRQLTVGESYRLSGTVYAGSGDRLTKVTAAVTGPGIPGSNTIAMNSGTINTALFSLNNFVFNTSTFNQPGTYTIGVWATTVGHPNPSAALGSFRITVKKPVDNAPYYQSISLPTKAKIPNSIYFSGYSRDDKGLAKITMMVTGPRGSEIQAWSYNVSGISKSLSGYSFDSGNSSYAGVPGNYRVAIWTKDTAGQTVEKVFNVTVSTSPPWVSGLSSGKTLAVGDSYTLRGTVYAGAGDHLTRVTAAVTGPGIPVSNNSAMTSGSISRSSFGLSGFTFRTSTFDEPGVYTIGIWATTTCYPDPDNAIDYLQITVRDASYTIDGKSTTAGGGTWGAIMKLTASLSGTDLTLKLTRKDGGSWTSSGYAYFKVGTYESYGSNRNVAYIRAGDRSETYTHDLGDYNGYPKEFYVRYEATAGGYAWVGPITVSLE